jgi:uncharacterized protein (TIGR00251 family)
MLSARLDGVSIVVKVKAGSKRPGLTPMTEWLRVDVRAPAVDGKANAAVCTMLKEHFRCGVEILRGERDSRKVLLLVGLTLAQAEAGLQRLVSDLLPDVRDGLSRAERLLLFEMQKAQEELGGRRVPSSLLYGRVVEHGVNLDPQAFEALLAKLARG